ncbi:MAG: putative glycoside hydrolase [Patescibacteria group bacterium]
MVRKKQWNNSVAFSLGGLVLVAGIATAATSVGPKVSFMRNATTTPAALSFGGTKPEKPAATHIPTPTPVKAIYMTQCAVGTPSFRESLTKLIDSTELNAIVIDIRDYTGKIAFPTDNPALKEYVSDECGANDMRAFVRDLHEKNIYVIGRITVFQNPAYTKAHPDEAVQKVGGGVWKDHKGLAFVDVGAKPYWDNVVELSKEAYALGFDELNYDYIRFPSDGDMKSAVYAWDPGKPKQEALERFFKYLHENVKPTGVVMSADLFGMTATNYDDLNIGQVLERALPYFDFIDPMVYPSHYPTGFNGYKDVNANSYNIVRFSMSKAVERTVATTTSIASLAYTRIGTSTPAVYEKPSYPASKMRPWLQSFDYPVTYTGAMVAEQIKANTDAGLDSYLFWDPANKYRSLREVLAPQ